MKKKYLAIAVALVLVVAAIAYRVLEERNRVYLDGDSLIGYPIGSPASP